MNANTNEWILCPSKRFPGKFYYFNMVNGDTVWSLQETDTMSLKTCTLSDTPYTCTGQSYPPDNKHIRKIPDPRNTSIQDYRSSFTQSQVFGCKNTFSQHKYVSPLSPQHQVFGQAIFPKPLQNYGANAKWPLFKVAHSPEGKRAGIFLQEVNHPPSSFAEVRPVYPKKIDMTNPFGATKNDTYFDDQCSIQSLGFSKLDLNKEYTKPKPLIAKPTLNLTQNNPTQITKKSNLFLQTFDKNSNECLFKKSLENPFKKPQANNVKSTLNQSGITGISKLQNNNKNSEGNIKIASQLVFDREKWTTDGSNKGTNHLQIHRMKTTRDFENIAPKNKEKATLMTNAEDTSKPEDLGELNYNDLRMVIQARRRKLVDSGKNQTYQGKKIKTSKLDPAPVTPKKKVTFNLENESYSDSKTQSAQNSATPINDVIYPENVPVQNNSCSSEVKTSSATKNVELWYIVVDTDVLLEDFDVFDSFLKMDTKCRLVIPYKVMSEVIALSRGESGERRRVMIARYSVRLIASQPDKVIVQPSQHEKNSVDDEILHCCLEKMKENTDVILITNNMNLQSNARIFKIKTYKLQEFKDANFKKQQVHFEIHNFKISIPNKDTNTTHAFKTNIFDNIDTKTQSKWKTSAEKYINTFKSNSEDNTTPFQIRKVCKLNTKENLNANFSPLLQSESTFEMDTVLVTDENNKNVHTVSADSKKPSDLVQKLDSISVNPQNLTKPETVLQRPDKDQETTVLKNNIAVSSVERFKAKTKMLEERIESRQEEYLCSFRQIMEECLKTLLYKFCITQPLTLYDYFDYIINLYDRRTNIKKIISTLKNLMYDRSCVTEKLRVNIKANEVTEVVRGGLQLIQYLKDVKASNTGVLRETELSLRRLLKNIQDPMCDREDTDVEFSPLTNIKKSDASPDDMERRRNFVKNRSEIISYLKKHFADWALYDDGIETKGKPNGEHNSKDIKVVRTYGKNLGLLKINKSNTMTMTPKENSDNTVDNVKKSDNTELENTIETATKDAKKMFLKTNDKFKDLKLSFVVQNTPNTGTDIEANVSPNGTEEIELDHSQTAPKIVRLFTDKKLEDIIKKKDAETVDVESAHQNTFTNESDINANNLRLLRAFEQKQYDMEELDYTTDKEIKNESDCLSIYIDETAYDDELHTNVFDHLNNNFHSKNDKPKSDNASFATDHRSYSMSLDSCVINDINQNGLNDANTVRNDNASNDKYTNDKYANDLQTERDTEYDSLQAFALQKTFLFELNNTFVLMHQFILKSVEEIKTEKMEESKILLVHKKSYTMYLQIEDMIEKLKSIIKRESTEIKTSNGRMQDPIDKTAISYRQLVQQSLEQALLLEGALEKIMFLTESL